MGVLDDPKNQACGRHGRFTLLSCLGCRRYFCEACHHYTINGRPWCPSCAQQHLPRPHEKVASTVVFLAKVVACFVAVGFVFLMIPFWTGRLGATVAVAYILLRIFWFRGTHMVHGTRIDEIQDGGASKEIQ